MKKIVLAAALLMIGALAHAASHRVEGVTIHVQHGCRSGSCVSVHGPRKMHKDTTRFASSVEKDEAAPAAAPATATPAK